MPVVNPEILIWARESSGLNVEDAAKKLQFKDGKTATGAAKLRALENGKEPTRPQLLRMSKQYRKPLLAFYLERPPVKADRGEDYRTLPDGIEPADEYLVDVLIRDIKARQSFLRDTMIAEEEGEVLSFIGSATMDQRTNDVAKLIAEHLAFDLAEFRHLKTVDEAFTYLRDKVEGVGVFVLLAGNLGSHHSAIDTKIFRGFVLSDNIAPFIVINDQDAKTAWCFTLLHEMTHLILGQTGISGEYDDNKVERFCNDVASLILLPEQKLDAFNPETGNLITLAKEISNYANARNISSSLVGYRLLKTKKITRKQWEDLSELFKKQWLQNEKAQRDRNRMREGGPSYYVVRRSKLGNALLGFTERMVYSGALTFTKAGMLLDVKPLKVQKLFDSGKVA